MAKILAVNEKGQKQYFSQFCWDKLGRNKNGWTEVAGQQVNNVVEEAPYMGPKIVNNKNQVVENTAKKEEVKTADEIFDEKYNKQSNVSQSKVDDFYEHIEGYNKTTIKDFFDKQTPSIEYSNGAKLNDLKEQLAKHFNYNVVELQKSFS